MSVISGIARRHILCLNSVGNDSRVEACVPVVVLEEEVATETCKAGVAVDA